MHSYSQDIAVRNSDGNIFKIMATVYTKFGAGVIVEFSDDLIHVKIKQFAHELEYKAHEFEIKDIQYQQF